MSSFTPTLDDNYQQYAELLLLYHRLLLPGKDESDEAEAVENEMTELWGRLASVQQIMTAQGISF